MAEHPSTSTAGLTHLDAQGRAHMVDIGDKNLSYRVAKACGALVMKAETLALALSGMTKKGDLFAAGQLAGIMAAKKTHELIPLCHTLNLSKVLVDITPDETLPGLRIRAEARTMGQTGVEMEALTAVSVAALTLYDMLKASDRMMRIESIMLEEKTGGSSGDWRREDTAGGHRGKDTNDA